MSRARGPKPPPEPEPDDPALGRFVNDRVIHTRVPEALDSELKDQARRLGMSVSNLIRNLLANTVGVVNDFVAEGDDIVRTARDSIDHARQTRRTAPPRSAHGAPTGFAGGFAPTHASPQAAGYPVGFGPTAAPVIVGWQPVVLERNAICHVCNDILPRGSDAALAAFDGPAFPGPRPTLCITCLEDLRHGSSPPAAHPESFALADADDD